LWKFVPLFRIFIFVIGGIKTFAELFASLLFLETLDLHMPQASPVIS
jgi:hypothetical protein